MGTSGLRDAFSIWSEDHPHAYGDKSPSSSISSTSLGSSPRVWGQGATRSKRKVQAGIIPTRMGTSGTTRYGGYGPKDHPHAYGDKTKEIKENSGFAKSTA
mgnify:CR=1 FL=1